MRLTLTNCVWIGSSSHHTLLVSGTHFLEIYTSIFLAKLFRLDMFCCENNIAIAIYLEKGR